MKRVSIEFDFCVEKVIPMAGKGTGKYYAPVYRAKKSPAKLRRGKLIKRCTIVAAAVAIAAVAIAAVTISRKESESFVKVAASEMSLANVASYPRVVNHEAPLPEEYVPENLMALGTLPNGENAFLRADAAEAFLEMCRAMSEDGLGIVPVQGYLSYEDQCNAVTTAADRLVAGGVDPEAAKKRAESEVFAPGEDEAQLGTTIEISTNTYSFEGFNLTEQYLWICRNAHKYGYVIRYTSDKEAVTGVSARQWRLRYVGGEAAEYIASTGICLEEYVSAVKADNPDAVEID